MNVLAINPGSSTLKFAVHRIAAAKSEAMLTRGMVERLGEPEARLVEYGPGSEEVSRELPLASLSDSVAEATRVAGKFGVVSAVGCRVVHGGTRFFQPTAVTDAVLSAIRSLAPLAPLHNVRDMEAIAAARKALPDSDVVAVFDSAFHRNLPERAYRYALPAGLGQDVRRYGFHGISFRYVYEILKELAPSSVGRIVACHLGSGASVCAIRDGVSVDTSMGMTPLEGLIMGTRSGDVDPGLLLYLMREKGKSHAELDELLNHRSGLLALSGVGSDVRDIERAAECGNESASFAIEAFCYRVAKYVASYAVALDGLDTLAFTGGIGEGSAQIRERICRHLRFLGVELDDTLNQVFVGGDKALATSPIQVWVVSADEERQIAEETAALMHRVEDK